MPFATRVPVVLVPIIALAALATASSRSFASAGTTPFRFGPYVAAIGSPAGALEDPSDSAIGADGRIYVVERNAHRVSIWRLSDGGPQRVGGFGRFGGGEGEFRSPEGIAVGADGVVVVADTGNHRVQLFDADGGFLRQWGTLGATRDQFNRPSGVAIDPSWIYVADTNNDRVLVFERSGRFVTMYGGTTLKPGDPAAETLHRPEAVATDGGNLVFIADTDANRLLVFDKAGRFVRRWGDFGPFVGMMDQPSGLDVHAGEVFVADTRNHRIEIFDTEGALLREWGNHARRPREGEGRLHYPKRVAIAPDGSFAAIVEPFEDRVQLFRAARPGEAETPRSPIPPEEQTHFGRRLAAAGDLLTIPEPELHDAMVFDLRGPVPLAITRFGGRGSRFGLFERMTGVAIDYPARRVQVADEALGRIQTFRLEWDPAAPVRFVPLMARFVRSLECSTDEGPFRRAAWPMRPTQIRRDALGRLHVVDVRNRMIFVYDAKMDALLAYGGAAAGPAELLEPNDVAVSAPGDLFFVADPGRRDIVAFDPRGQFMFAFGREHLARPFGIVAGRDGFVYVTDEALHKVVKFTEAGKFVSEWGRKGTADGELWKPAGIDQLADGRLVLVDWGNHRAQIFSTTGAWLATFGAGQASTVEAPLPPPTRGAQDED